MSFDQIFGGYHNSCDLIENHGLVQIAILPKKFMSTEVNSYILSPLVSKISYSDRKFGELLKFPVSQLLEHCYIFLAS